MMVNETTESSEMIGSGGSIGPITWDDATWILTSAFIIFTMQSGFGLLEAGCVSGKNEVNIMVKNAVDVVFGGLSYWAFGFGFSFGMDNGTNPFCGIGYFLVDSTDANMGILYSTFVFQMSFATTATTIVSGAMAERTKLTAYILFSFFNTLIYCMPAHWEWAENGFLRALGCVDVAGSGAVHLVGGVSALVAAAMLGPRLGRYDDGDKPLPMGNPVSALIGLFMLWWGWLAFNCGSTFGISGGKWKLAAKSAVTTLNGSMGGGACGIIISYIVNRRKYDVAYIINSVLGALVSITAACAVIRPWEAIIIGAIGGIFALVATKLMDKLNVDDPVGAVGVHGACGLWGLLSVGLFADFDPFENTTQGRRGLFYGGGFYLLGVQTLSAVVIIAWSAILTFSILFLIKKTVGLRMSVEDELRGADYTEHGIEDGSPDTNIYTFNSSNTENTDIPKTENTPPIKTINLPGSVQQSEEINSVLNNNKNSSHVNNDTNLVANGNRRGSNLNDEISIVVSNNRRGSLLARRFSNNRLRPLILHKNSIDGGKDNIAVSDEIRF